MIGLRIQWRLDLLVGCSLELRFVCMRIPRLVSVHLLWLMHQRMLSGLLALNVPHARPSHGPLPPLPLRPLLPPLPLASASTPARPRQRPKAAPGACVVTGWTRFLVEARTKEPVRRAKEWMLEMKEARELKKAQMAGVAALSTRVVVAASSTRVEPAPASFRR